MICAKDNPFAVRRIEALGYIPFGVSWDRLMLWLEELNYTTAIVGDHGSGKTTLLEALERKLHVSGIQTDTLFMSNDVCLPWRTIEDRTAAIPSGGVLFFDGACHLSRWRWRQLRQQAHRQRIGLVITSHSEGELSTLICCRPGPETLIGLVKELLGQISQERQAECIHLFRHYRGNIRDCLRHLYDAFAVRA